MQKDTDIVQEIGNFLLRIWGWVAIFSAAIIGKIGLYLKGDKKETGWQLLGSFFTAVSVGFITSVICMKYYPAAPGSISVQGAILIPTATWLSDKIVLFVINIDVSKAADIFRNKTFLEVLKIVFKNKK